MCFVMALLAVPVLSAEELERQRLQGTIDATLDVLYGAADISFDEKQGKVREILEKNYDLDVMIRRAIGRNWRLMSELEQVRVLELVRQLVLKAYIKALEGKDRPVVNLGEEILISDKRMEIESTVTLGKQNFYILYRLGRMRSGWQIYDIVAESSISVVSNYRQQFDDHFRKGSGAELITRLEDLLQQDVINEETKI
jgi:phospholipid transport system substrate-binding protein